MQRHLLRKLRCGLGSPLSHSITPQLSWRRPKAIMFVRRTGACRFVRVICRNARKPV